jgi:hypothetical protein
VVFGGMGGGVGCYVVYELCYVVGGWCYVVYGWWSLVLCGVMD